MDQNGFKTFVGNVGSFFSVDYSQLLRYSSNIYTYTIQRYKSCSQYLQAQYEMILQYFQRYDPEVYSVISRLQNEELMGIFLKY